MPRPRLLEVALLFGVGCISAETIVPVPHAGHKMRGVRVSHLQHRGLAGVEPGHYQGMVSYSEMPALLRHTCRRGCGSCPARPTLFPLR